LVKFYDENPDLVVTELYDLSKDLGENDDIRALRPELSAKLEKQLDAYLKQVGGRIAHGEAPKKKKRKSDRTSLVTV
jgi:hypothetical protein